MFKASVLEARLTRGRVHGERLLVAHRGANLVLAQFRPLVVMFLPRCWPNEEARLVSGVGRCCLPGR
jgi:hypothetical protein